MKNKDYFFKKIVSENPEKYKLLDFEELKAEYGYYIENCFSLDNKYTDILKDVKNVKEWLETEI